MKTAPDKARVSGILKRLDEAYGTEDIIYLTHEKDWQLLVAVILSAQCTDARVNMVTPHLFARYDTLEKLAEADQGDLEEEIRSIGFFHAKAKNIIGCAKRLTEVYGGRVPDNMEDLLTLPGVGRKTANVMLGNVFHEPSIRPDARASEGPLDPLQYADHHAGKNHLYGQKTGLRAVFFTGGLSVRGWRHREENHETEDKGVTHDPVSRRRR